MKLDKDKIGTSKAAGEALACYKLARRGWLPVNVNSGVSNMPNLDLIAFKGKRQVTIQVKAAVGKGWTMFSGRAKPEGGYFNTKPGPKAEFAVCIRLEPESDEAVCYVMPIKTAERLSRQLVREHMKKPKRDGGARELNFPVWIKDTKLAKWREAWHLLDG